MGSIVVINDESHFHTELSNAGPRLVIADFTASWCGPCQRMAPIFQQLSTKYAKALFLKIDVDKCQDTAAAQGVSAMPTFIFYRNKAKVDRLQGADPNALENKIQQYYGFEEGDEGEAVAGHMDLLPFISKSQCECLNESDEHPLEHCLSSGGGFLQSDCDEQLIISITFNQAVKIHSLKIKAPADKGPKNVKLFINQPRTLDFDMADSNTSVQDLELQLLECLSDAGKLLSELHHSMSVSRRVCITPGLNKSVKNLVHQSPIDSFLYGENLSERLKEAKSIERTGQDLKSHYASAKKASGGQQTTSITVPIQGTAGTAIQSSTGTSEETAEKTQKKYLEITQPPIAQEPFPGGREVIRRSYAIRNIPEASLKFLLASLSEATIRQYTVMLKHWWLFCLNHGYNPFSANTEEVLEFLSLRFELGASYGTLNSARAAISLISVSDIMKSPVISRFFKGVFRLRPIKPKYTVTWNTDLVLDKLSHQSLENLNLEQLTKRAVLLLALATAPRVQTIYLIDIGDVHASSLGFEIKVFELIKTSGPGRAQPLLMVPFFPDRPEVCVATTLRTYIRGTTTRLFISFKKPHRAVSAQTLSRWLKESLAECGVDTRLFTGHSTRHAATTAAYGRGTDFEAIRKAAGWSEKSQVFAHFYNRPTLDNRLSFAKAVLNPR